VSARKIDADGVLLDLEFKCEPAKQNYEIRANFIKRMFAGHRHLIRANLPGGLFAGTLVVARSQIRLSVDGHRAREGQGSRFLSLLAFGFEHILTGFDHLVFLLALILVCLRFKPLLILITAFTVGHSVTLSLAALDIWSPDSNLVELLIAATIIYVGIENLVTRNPKHRWYLTLLFGLVHGFGFASMLTARGLDPNQLVLDLVAFNFGVELGQICCLLLVVPILKGLRRAAWFDSWGFMGLNALIIMAGVYWFQDRLWNLWC